MLPKVDPTKSPLKENHPLNASPTKESHPLPEESIKEDSAPKHEIAKPVDSPKLKPKPKSKPKEPLMALHVARFNHEATYKQWSLYIEGPRAETRVQHRIVGPNAHTYFEYEKIFADPAKDQELVQMSFLCIVSLSHFDAVNTLAESMSIYHYRREWDCQVYVLDLVNLLESAGIIDLTPERWELYQEYKEVVQGYLEEGVVPPLRGLWDRSLWGAGI